MFEFHIKAEDGRARTGLLITPHGPVHTPLFMPVGTQATVKSLTPAELAAIGSQVVLANTYHLLLRPGPQIIANLGGLHGFTAYAGPWLTDSGGFQVMSLGHRRTIQESGVTFQNHLNGDLIHLSPERSIAIQEQLGADIIMALDECPPYPSSSRYQQDSAERTLRWLERSMEAHTQHRQALFGIAQGGTDPALRRWSTEQTTAFDLPGYAIGGLAVGEPKEATISAVALSTAIMPEDRPRYLMGVGHPEDLVAAIGLGVDMFDCVYPTRTGRFGYALTDQGRLNFKSAAHKNQDQSIDPDCDCYACRTFSRAYLTHLVRSGEILGLRMLSLHNLRYLHRLGERASKAIATGQYAYFAQTFSEARFAGTTPAWFQEALLAGGHRG